VIDIRHLAGDSGPGTPSRYELGSMRTQFTISKVGVLEELMKSGSKLMEVCLYLPASLVVLYFGHVAGLGDDDR
jgi:hypothetical protein